MLESTDAYKAAVVADSRRVHIRAVVDMSDPDMDWGSLTGSNLAPWSKPDQIHDKNMDAPERYATLEKNRWILSGDQNIFPNNYATEGQTGIATSELSGANGTFASPVSVQISVSNTSIIQAASFFFSPDEIDGIPEDFTIEVFYGSTAYYSKSFTGNKELSVYVEGFTVYNPTSIKITCTKMNLPGRRFRLVEVIVGIYANWSGADLAGFSVSNQGDFSCLTLPYGTADLAIDNSDRRFEPRRKEGLFQSIEERQGIALSVGVELPSGTVEYKPVGVYYQSGDGWKASQNSATITWSLIDIVGLLCNRTFIVPDTLPTTLEGWIAAVVAQLGKSFETAYRIDPSYKSKSVTAKNKDNVTGKKCGDIIRWACMASGTWPRAAAETGYLTAEPLWNQGSKITLEALTQYPAMKANESIASLIFQLYDGTELVISGNATSAQKTVTIQNPFIHTADQAREAARLILSCYGGNVIDTTGRGDPASEIGDVDTVWLDQSNATTARRKEQTLEISNGVLQGCKSTLLQADGSYLWNEYAIMTESGAFTAPAGVDRLFIALGGGGQGGGHGENGYIRDDWGQVAAGYGKSGADGTGGKIWYGVININPQQTFQVNIGPGGVAATSGTEATLGGNTTCGELTSANGEIYPNGYSDIATGLSFGRTGVPSPAPGTSDGGKGGEGGEPGAGYTYETAAVGGYGFVVTKAPGKGKAGSNGGSGFALFRWEKPQ